ncbi:MAG: hypothetical protein Greene041619_915 [Candidatus Peregrinibacteria bacterium Greene0416_19]|nr:MAG: hypothetical protein Greene041619_915 [Candidatus Peregrinibacteria bacterium Greene0416_19]
MRAWHWPEWTMLAFVVAGIVLRLQAARWNSFTHGDVQMDTTAGATLLGYGGFLMTNEDLCVLPDRLAGLPPLRDTFPMALHGPGWALLGAGMNVLRGAPVSRLAVFFSLRLLSLIAGIAVLWFAHRLTRQVAGRSAAWAVTGVLSLSYLLADFAGNGALYSLQTLLYLLWISVARREDAPYRAVLLGTVGGVAYLLNFQSIILLPAAFFLFALHDTGPLKKRVVNFCIVVGVTALIMLPWLLRNAELFGNPFQSHYLQQTYIYNKAGLVPNAGGTGPEYTPSVADWLSIIAGMFRVWLPNNLYYAARKLFILAPVLFIFFSFGLIDYVFDPVRRRKLLPILLVLGFHLLLSSVWPVMKFRHLVPILPIVALLGVEHLYSLRLGTVARRICVGTSVACTAIVTVIAHVQIPTHTFYYDGAVTQDAYHGSQELQVLRECGLLPAA